MGCSNSAPVASSQCDEAVVAAGGGGNTSVTRASSRHTHSKVSSHSQELIGGAVQGLFSVDDTRRIVRRAARRRLTRPRSASNLLPTSSAASSSSGAGAGSGASTLESIREGKAGAGGAHGIKRQRSFGSSKALSSVPSRDVPPLPTATEVSAMLPKAILDHPVLGTLLATFLLCSDPLAIPARSKPARAGIVGANRGGTTPQSEKVLGEFDERAWRFLRDMSIARELEGAQLLATGARKASGQASGVLGAGAGAGAGKMGASSSSIPSSAILPGGALHRSSVLGDPQRASVYLASSAATLEAFVAAMQDWYLRPSSPQYIGVPASQMASRGSVTTASSLQLLSKVEAKIISRVTAIGVDLFKAAVARQALLSSVVPSAPPAKGPIVQIDGVPLVVVIIGAGFCGMGVLKNLQQHPGLFRVIIIDQRDYFEFSPFVISRLAGGKPRSKTTWVPIRPMCGTAEFVCGKVNLVTPAFVDVGYQRIRYDYLVVASGSKCASNLRPKSLTLAGRAGSVDLEAQQVMSSSVATVVVVGGGLTAVEYAAALKTHAPSKSVILVTKSAVLVPEMRPAVPTDPVPVREQIMERLAALGVEVLLGSEVDLGKHDLTGPCFVTTQSGRVIHADRVVWCRGTAVTTSYLKPFFGHILDPQGKIKVVRTMQVVGSPHIFAGGDACMRSPLEYKCIRTALRHSAVIANNIVRMTRGKAPVEHKPDKGYVRSVVALGTQGGIVTGANWVECNPVTERDAAYSAIITGAFMGAPGYTSSGALSGGASPSADPSVKVQHIFEDALNLELDRDEAGL